MAESDDVHKALWAGNSSDYICAKEGHDFSVRDREVSALDGFIRSKPLCSLREKGGPTLNLCIRCGRFIQVPDEPVK